MGFAPTSAATAATNTSTTTANATNSAGFDRSLTTGRAKAANGNAAPAAGNAPAQGGNDAVMKQLLAMMKQLTTMIEQMMTLLGQQAGAGSTGSTGDAPAAGDVADENIDDCCCCGIDDADDNTTPAPGTGNGSNPAPGTGNGSNPAPGTGNGSNPAPGTGNGSNPAPGTGNGSNPAPGTGNGSNPAPGTGNGSNPAPGTGNGSNPAPGTGNGSKPAMSIGPNGQKGLWDVAITTSGQGQRTGAVNYGHYNIAFDQNDAQVTILNTKTGEKTKVWGDPHITSPNGKDQTITGDFRLRTADGLIITIQTVDANGKPVSKEGALTAGTQAVESYSDTVTISGLGDSVTVTNVSGRSAQGKGLDIRVSDQNSRTGEGLRTLTNTNGLWGMAAS